MEKIIDDTLAKLIFTVIPNKKDISTIGYAIQMINAERSNFVNSYMWFLLANALCYIKSKDFGIILSDELYQELDNTIDTLTELLNKQN